MIVLDAPELGYTATLSHRAESSTAVTCKASYYRGECTLPSLVTGDFYLSVATSAGSLVGTRQHNFSIDRCPQTYVLGYSDGLCKCEAGSYDKGTECAACPDGTVAPNLGALLCAACPARQTSDAKHTSCECVEDYYRNVETNACELCPKHVDCAWNSTIADWRLKPGIWRSGALSTELRACRFGSISCPADATLNDSCTARGFGDWPYCACSYVGPTCGVCDANYFLSWTGDECQICGASHGHTPTIVLASVLAFLIAVGGGVVYAKQTAITSVPCVAKAQKLYAIGETKATILFFMGQVRPFSSSNHVNAKSRFTTRHPSHEVISSYSKISSGAGSKGHPEPAASFAGALAITNIDFLQFVPMSCIFSSQTDFYWQMCVIERFIFVFSFAHVVVVLLSSSVVTGASKRCSRQPLLDFC